MVAAVKGYKLILVMSESMSLERRRLMLAYGATFDLTPKEKGMKGAIERALELIAQTPGSWMPQQFENPANIAVHAETTAQEILKDFARSEEHTSELQSLMRISYAVFCLKKKKQTEHIYEPNNKS